MIRTFFRTPSISRFSCFKMALCSDAKACVTPPVLCSMTLGRPFNNHCRMRVYAFEPPWANTPPTVPSASNEMTWSSSSRKM